jgi:hypothetical protein
MIALQFGAAVFTSTLCVIACRHGLDDWIARTGDDPAPVLTWGLLREIIWEHADGI